MPSSDVQIAEEAPKPVVPIKVRVPWESLPLSDFLCLRNKYVLLNLLSRNLKLKYRKSIFGYLWTLLIPLSQAIIFYFVYRVVLKIQIENYVSFIISGLLPWVFFVTSLNESMESLVGNHHLLLHAPIPIQVFPASVTHTNFINLLPSIPLIFLVYIVDVHAIPGWHSLLILPLCILLFIYTYALSFLLACLYVYLRDLKHLINIVIQLWLYLTPVLYRAEMIPKEYRWVVSANPIAGFFIAFRQCLFEARFPDSIPLLTFTTWTAATLIFAEVVRRKIGGTLVERM